MTVAEAAAVAAAHAEHGERERGLAPEVVDALRAGDLFRLCVPRALGGAEAPPLALVEAVETLAQADASSGWCLAVTATSGLVAAYLDEDAAREVYGTAGMAVGGVFAPRGRAVAVAGDLEVSGRWSFASGSTFCDWLMGGCVTERDGEGPSSASSSSRAPTWRSWTPGRCRASAARAATTSPWTDCACRRRARRR